MKNKFDFTEIINNIPNIKKPTIRMYKEVPVGFKDFNKLKVQKFVNDKLTETLFFNTSLDVYNYLLKFKYSSWYLMEMLATYKLPYQMWETIDDDSFVYFIISNDDIFAGIIDEDIKIYEVLIDTDPKFKYYIDENDNVYRQNLLTNYVIECKGVGDGRVTIAKNHRVLVKNIQRGKLVERNSKEINFKGLKK